MYDLIGDIHGHADELICLLEQLGYDRRRGYYAHPSRTAVFVGDFIDRGPQIREVLGLVRPMVESGGALAVMGNHEFNAIAYHTGHPRSPDRFLRRHDAKNIQQHLQTLRQLSAEELYEAIAWFKTLPLWLELKGLRVVHACWNAPAIACIQQVLLKYDGLDDRFMCDASTEGHPLYAAVETILKGQEIKLPEGLSFVDKDGHERHMIRIRWYQSPAERTFRSYCLPPNDRCDGTLIPESLTASVVPYGDSEVPVFFGHYWLQDKKPTLLANNVACLDYSVAKGGLLCAYRWTGEQPLTERHFAVVKATDAHRHASPLEWTAGGGIVLKVPIDAVPPLCLPEDDDATILQDEGQPVFHVTLIGRRAVQRYGLLLARSWASVQRRFKAPPEPVFGSTLRLAVDKYRKTWYLPIENQQDFKAAVQRLTKILDEEFRLLGKFSFCNPEGNRYFHLSVANNWDGNPRKSIGGITEEG